MRRLERILLSKVKVRVWIVVVTLTLAAAGTMVFGAFVKDAAERGVRGALPRGGALGRVAFEVAEIPRYLYRFHIAGFSSQAPEQRFHGRSGLTFAHGSSRRSVPPTPHGPEAGYLVVVRYVPERRFLEPGAFNVVIELIDLNQRKTIHVWEPPPDSAPSLTMLALPLSDGSLILETDGTTRLDPCSNLVWRKRIRTHHTIERDANGNFWMPQRVVPRTVPQSGPRLHEHGLISISPDGEVLSRIALSGALIRSGHRHLLYGVEKFGEMNPFHMNDVEPVLEDGPFWRRGDLFVSLRTNSVVLLYRPATDEVLWLRSGPWLHQHDVDIVGESEISVFSNNAADAGDGKGRVLGANEVYVYDFATGEARSPWREAMRRHDVRTPFRGSATVLDDGGLIVEETNYGRVLRLSADGELVWSYVNRAPDGLVHQLAGVRYLDAQYGAGMARSIASFDCEAG